jgi:hypothetical protein
LTVAPVARGHACPGATTGRFSGRAARDAQIAASVDATGVALGAALGGVHPKTSKTMTARHISDLIEAIQDR